MVCGIMGNEIYDFVSDLFLIKLFQVSDLVAGRLPPMFFASRVILVSGRRVMSLHPRSRPEYIVYSLASTSSLLHPLPDLTIHHSTHSSYSTPPLPQSHKGNVNTAFGKAEGACRPAGRRYADTH